MRASILLAAVALAAAAPAARAASCGSTSGIPTWEQVNGFPLGDHAPTPEQVSAYVSAVDRASARIRSGVLGTSAEGRPLSYAIVSTPQNLSPGRLAAFTARMRAVRAGHGSPRPSDPAIAWVTGGIHPNEPSGTSADMQLLYDLATTRSCSTLRSVVAVIVPLQNPDGRAADTRVNASGFDLNRDWFAATQPETRAKLAMLQRMPPVALGDQHEEPGTTFFFPPNADPIHHEIGKQALSAINATFGPALGSAFHSHHLPYVHYEGFDLFFLGYTDTVTTTLFGAAGMTFEKGNGSAYAVSVAEQLLAAHTLLDTTAKHRAALLSGWAALWRDARAEGARGQLAPNRVTQPGDRVRFAVPHMHVFDYVIRTDHDAADATELVRRLRAVGVTVRALRRPLAVPAFRAYGSAAAGAANLPAGTWVVPMAQAQKHWIEGMLGQDPYVPFPYFYDVSSWSNPLLMDLDGGWSERPIPAGALDGGAEPATGPAGAGPAYAFAGDSAGALELTADLLSRGLALSRAPDGTVTVPENADLRTLRIAAAAHLTPVATTAGPAAGSVALRAPRVALLADPTPIQKGPAGSEDSALHASDGWTRFVLERRLGVGVDQLSDRDIQAGKLATGGYTAFVVPDDQIPALALGGTSLTAIQTFVRSGGTFVGVRNGGLAVARAAALTTVSDQTPSSGYQVPGATFDVLVDQADPVAWGFGPQAWIFNAADPVFSATAGAVTYPAGGGIVSGYASGAGALRGTAALIDAPLGAGRVVLFAFDPSFRAYTEGGERFLANALLAPPTGVPAVARAATARRVEPALLRSRGAARDGVVRVAARDAAALRAAPIPPGGRIERVTGGLELRVPNPLATPGEDLAWVRPLLGALRRAGVRPTLIAL